LLSTRIDELFIIFCR